MKFWWKGAMAASVMAAASLVGGSAFAQSPCPVCGPQAEAKKIDPAIYHVADEMGLVRSTSLLIGQMHIIEMAGSGKMVDLEAATLGQPVDVSKITWNVNMQLHASRVTYQAGSTQTIRVVKNGRGWNETWTADKKKLNTAPVDPAVAALRSQLVWFEPHAFITAAAFASDKKCLLDTAKACSNAVSVGQENGKTVITVEMDGTTYKGTVDAKNRIASVEGTIKLPGGAAKKLVATYGPWRSGEKIEVPHDPDYGKNSMDQFHNGNYFPEKITWDLDGTRVLDLAITAGWGNPYTVYPEPELLAKAQ